MHYTFTTPQPVHLSVELRSGDLVVHATDTVETTVDVTGPDADDVTVEQRGEEILVSARRVRRGFLGGDSPDLRVHVSVPLDSAVSTKLGSADVRVEGRVGEVGIATGSGTSGSPSWARRRPS